MVSLVWYLSLSESDFRSGRGVADSFEAGGRAYRMACSAARMHIQGVRFAPIADHPRDRLRQLHPVWNPVYLDATARTFLRRGGARLSGDPERIARGTQGRRIAGMDSPEKTPLSRQVFS
jgi:hypothetical protein